MTANYITTAATFTKFDKPIRRKDLEFLTTLIRAHCNYHITIHSLDGGHYTAERHDRDFQTTKLCNSLTAREMASFLQGLYIGLNRSFMDQLEPRTDLTLPRHKL